MNKIYSKFLDDCSNIEKYYEKLVDLTKNHHFVGSTNEWIIDNFYLVVEQRNAIKKLFKSSRYIFNIGVIIKTDKKEYDTKIIGKVKNSLITIDNVEIPIIEIKDIIIKDRI